MSLRAYLQVVKLVARTEASSSTLRFRVSRGCRLFAILATKSMKKQKGRVLPCLRLSVFSHKGHERQEQDLGEEEPSAANNFFFF